MGGTRLRGGLGGVVVLLVLALGVGAGDAAAVPPPPPNPNDEQLSGGKAETNAKATQVGQLINQVAQAEAQLVQLRSDVELTMEEANRAIVDLTAAQDAAAEAEADAGAAKAAADTASKDIVDARKDLDEFAVASYKQGTTVGSMSAYIGSKSPDDLLQRAQLLEAVGSSRLDALDLMEVARTGKANKDSVARQALDIANQAQRAATAAKLATDAATAAAQQAQDQQASATQQLQGQKDAAESQLAAAQANVTGLESQRRQYLDWLAAKQAEDAVQNQPPPSAGGATGAGGTTGSSSGATGAGGGGGVEGDSGGDVVAPAPTGGVQAVIDRAMSQLGVPYAWGGGNADGPTRGIHDGGVADAHGDYNKIGFDCSGLMVYAFAAVGKSLPHYSGYQASAGRRVPLSQKAPGDMLFWATRGRIHHVALYIGDNKMVEAPHSGSHVRVSTVRYGGIVGYATRPF